MVESSATSFVILNCLIVVSMAIDGLAAISLVAFTCACTIFFVRSGSFFTKAEEATKPRLVLPMGESYGTHRRLPQPFTSANAA